VSALSSAGVVPWSLTANLLRSQISVVAEQMGRLPCRFRRSDAVIRLACFAKEEHRGVRKLWSRGSRLAARFKTVGLPADLPDLHGQPARAADFDR
jgi:hypothetical protein